MAEDFNEAVKEAEEKLEEKKDELEGKVDELKEDVKEKLAPAKAFLAKVKMNFGQVCDFLDNKVFGKVRKCYIAFGGLLLALLVWIF